MRISKLTFGLAALALVAAPAIAQSSLAPAVAPLSGGEEGQAESGSEIVLGILAAAAIVGAVIVATEDDSDNPVAVSP